MRPSFAPLFLFAASLTLFGQGCAYFNGTTDDKKIPEPPVSSTSPVSKGWVKEPPKFSFVHTKPGIQSEIYLDVFLDPPESSSKHVITVDMNLTGPGVIGKGDQQQTYSAAPIHFIFPINRFGEYTYQTNVTDDGKTVYSYKGTGTVK